MIKFFGITFILLGAVFTAIAGLREKRRRISCISSLCASLELMLGELKLHLTPIPQLTQWLAERSSSEAKEFFRKLSLALDSLGEEDFSTLWRKVSGTSLCLLEKKEFELFAQLGDVLGRYTLEEQCAAINHCLISFRRYAEKAQNEYPAAKKLSLGLSASAAVLLIIILL